METFMGAQKTIRIVIAEPGQNARIDTIPNTLDAMRALVGGLIALVRWVKWDVWANDEGLLEGLPPNRIVAGQHLVGTVFIAKSNEEGETIGLTEAEAEQARKALDACPRATVASVQRHVGKGDARE
jgi:hypothetical protein